MQVAETRTKWGQVLTAPLVSMGCGLALAAAGILPVDCPSYDVIWQVCTCPGPLLTCLAQGCSHHCQARNAQALFLETASSKGQGPEFRRSNLSTSFNPSPARSFASNRHPPPGLQFLMPAAAACFLLETDVTALASQGAQTLAAFLVGAAGMVAGAAAAYWLLSSWMGPHGGKLAACLCATYVGGSVNFVAVAKVRGEDAMGALVGVTCSPGGKAFVGCVPVDNHEMVDLLLNSWVLCCCMFAGGGSAWGHHASSHGSRQPGHGGLPGRAHCGLQRQRQGNRQYT